MAGGGGWGVAGLRCLQGGRGRDLNALRLDASANYLDQDMEP